MISLMNLYAADADLGRIREQAAEYFAQNGTGTLNRKILESQQPDGSWRDVDYGNRQRGHWPPRNHLTRVQQIASGYRRPGSVFCGLPEARDTVIRGLEYWALRDPTSPNWWHQSIGTPQLLCTTLLLLGDELPPGLLDKLTPILDRSKPGMTAQNRVWLAGIHLQKGVLYGKPEWVEEGAGAIMEELHLAPEKAEGIQPDWSFHQHGPQLQFGNYGLAFFNEMTEWATVLRGTRFAFPEEKMRILADYFDNGIRWVLFNRQMDFSACGRQINPGQPQAKYRAAVANANRLAAAYGNGRKKLGERDFRFSGSRFFPDSDFYVQRGPEYYWSVKMASPRTVPSETVNSENLLGRLAGHGATLFMSGNDEMRDIGGIWDWRKIPGVTSVQNDSSLLCRKPGHWNLRDWVGGVSDGEIGFCAMDFDNGEVAAKKSFFFFGPVMAAVGSRIQSGLDAPVLTTVAQFRSAGETVADEKMNEFRNGNFAYRLLNADRGARAETKEHTGNWKRVTDAMSAAPVKGELFTLAIDHGVRPQDGSYAYLAAFRAIPEAEIRLLEASSDAIHAVAGGGAVMAAFYEPGTVVLPDGTMLEAKQPALVMIRNGELRAADPGRKRKVFDFVYGGKKYRVRTPQGREAGRSVSVPLGK
ncbi:MAG: hypothetical protein HPZ91_12845 [Lentisphaeria bacterium]|nr:hypothetical protein [Lentisphaeria bacterium]